MLKASLVIPCYNEAANLRLLLPRCGELTSAGDVEVILVDNGSSDETPRLLADLLPQYPGCRSMRVDVNQGYGFGILSGLRAARGNVLGWTHADMQTDALDVRRGLALFEKHGEHNFVKGRRYGRPLTDVAFMIGMSAFETVLLRAPLWDINAQPNLFSRKFFSTWHAPPNDFSLDLFAYYQAKRQRVPVRRFSVHFGDRVHGRSHWNVGWAGKKKFITRTIDFSLELRRRSGS